MQVWGGKNTSEQSRAQRTAHRKQSIEHSKAQHSTQHNRDTETQTHRHTETQRHRYTEHTLTSMRAGRAHPLQSAPPYMVWPVCTEGV
jgi:hypothetical protein